MRIIIDTSVWVECQKDDKFGEAVARIIGRHEVLGCPTIDQEVQDAAAFLKGHGMNSEKLEAIYQTVRKVANDSIGEKEKEIEHEYLLEGTKLGLPLRGMKADLSIVALASVQNADAIISLNRKSMASDYARFVYMIVNSKHGLKVPQFITDRSMISKLSEI